MSTYQSCIQARSLLNCPSWANRQKKGAPIANDVLASVTALSLSPFSGWKINLPNTIWGTKLLALIFVLPTNIG